MILCCVDLVEEVIEEEEQQNQQQGQPEDNQTIVSSTAAAPPLKPAIDMVLQEQTQIPCTSRSVKEGYKPLNQ